MSERIDLARLKDWYSRDGSGVERIWSWEVLALVEVAEAAEAARRQRRFRLSPKRIRDHFATRRLEAALARFDFGEQA